MLRDLLILLSPSFLAGLFLLVRDMRRAGQRRRRRPSTGVLRNMTPHDMIGMRDAAASTLLPEQRRGSASIPRQGHSGRGRREPPPPRPIPCTPLPEPPVIRS